MSADDVFQVWQVGWTRDVVLVVRMSADEEDLRWERFLDANTGEPLTVEQVEQRRTRPAEI